MSNASNQLSDAPCEAIGSRTLKVLVVDDNQDILRVLKAVVVDAFPGTAVVTASGGLSGLELARTEDPDVILLDIVMPDMDGFEVCRRLKQDEELRSIPVVFLTAQRGDRENRVKALEAGGDAFLSKPIDELELTAQIRAMARIKAANRKERCEKDRLVSLVAERAGALERELAEGRRQDQALRLAHHNLEQSHASTLKVLGDLNAEMDARKRSDQALRDSEALYQSLVESIPQCIARKDRAGKFVYCNQNYCRWVGLSPAELLGKTDADFHPPDLAQRYLEDDQRVMAAGESLDLVEENITQGVRRFVQVFKSPVRDAKGRVVGVQMVFWDISERRRLETEREKVLADYQMLFNKMLDGFALHEILCDPEGKPVDYRFLTVNPAFEKLTGLRSQVVVGRTVREILPSIDSFWIETYGRVALSGEPASLEHYEPEIGRHFKVTAFSPAARHFACVFVDITERKAAEAGLVESRRQLQEMIEATPAGYFRIGADGRFLDVNPAWLRMHGFSDREEVIGSHFLLTQVEADMEEAETIVARVLGGERIRTAELSRRLKDGAVGWHSFSATPVLQDGRIVGLEGFLIDATDRRRVEANIERSEAELEAIYDSAPLMICLVNHQRQVERMNRTMAAFVGDQAPAAAPLCPGDLIGCVNALDDPRGCGFGAQCGTCPLRLGVLRTLEQGQSCRQVEAGLFVVRNGIRRQIEISASTALVRLHNQSKVLVCMEDITERKQLQAQFLQAQKMEAVGQLAGGVAHDFNNILAATTLHLQLLQENQDPSSEMAASLRELQEGTQRAAGLTRQLLLFSRRQVMQTRPVDLNEVIQGLLKMLARLLGEDINILFTPHPQPVTLNADVGMIEQVVMNLCVNARDAMPRGGDLQLHVRLATPDAETVRSRTDVPPGQFACLEAADTGCGMDEGTLKRIFEPFFTTKGPGKGTGLGLATIHGIVKQHHGWIEVDSVLNRGTTFRVILPAVQAPSVATPEPDPVRNGHGDETILLVEDDDQMRRMVRVALGKFGYKVLTARNGVEALKVWEQHGSRVNLLLTDMVMPGGISGIDIAQRLRRLQPGLKVVISSGYAPDLLDQTGGLPKSMRFLAKPYRPESLARTVRECLDVADRGEQASPDAPEGAR